MQQYGTIVRVIEALVLDISAEKVEWNPAKYKPISKEEDGIPMYGKFSYSSIFGTIM